MAYSILLSSPVHLGLTGFLNSLGLIVGAGLGGFVLGLGDGLGLRLDKKNAIDSARHLLIISGFVFLVLTKY